MLSIKQINRIRSLFYDEGLNLCQIARKLHYSVGTVRRYVHKNDFNCMKNPRIDSEQKILPYEVFIMNLLCEDRKAHFKQRITGRRVFDLLKEQFPEFDCSYSMTQKFFKKKREEFYSVSKQRVPLKHLPGTAQVDFGDFFYFNNGEKIKGYMAVVAFPYSNAVFCQVFKGKSSECLLQGLKNIFLHIGGVPHEISFDNDGAIVRVNGNYNLTKIPADLFLRFKNHYNFRHVFCHAFSPTEKANVEKGIHTIRMKILSPTPTIDNFDEFNENMLALCDASLTKKRKGFVNIYVSEMFATDKSNLIALLEIDFEVCTKRNRICDLMGNITIGGRFHYYLSPQYINKKVIIKTTYDKVYFYDEYERYISESDRIYDNDSAVVIRWGEYFKLLSRKTGALEHCDILSHFPEQLREFLLDSGRAVRQNYMKIMHEIYSESDFVTAITFAEKACIDCITDYAELVKGAGL